MPNTVEYKDWLSIPGHDGLFAHRSGKIKNSSGTIFSGKSKRYTKVSIKVNGRNKTLTAHRLLALTFIPNPENKPQINHKNGIKSDNRVDNLEWCTASENHTHAFKTGLRKSPCAARGKFGSQHPHSKKIVQKSLSGDFIATHGSMIEAANILGVRYTHIGDACHGRIKTAYGYKWEFAK